MAILIYSATPSSPPGPTFNDNFTGNDFDSLNSTNWTVTLSDINSEAYIYNNKARTLVGNTNGKVTVKSNVLFSDDIDIQIDWEESGSNNSWWQAEFNVKSESNGYWWRIIRCYTAGDKYRCDYYDGTYHEGTPVSVSDSSGKFRITRFNDAINLYYWDGSKWNQTSDNFLFNSITDTLFANFITDNGDFNPSHTVDWDNAIDNLADAPALPEAPWTETFTGYNGDLPNTSYWYKQPTSTGNSLTIQDNKLNGSLAAGTGTNEFSLFALSGDFNIQVDVDSFAAGANSVSLSLVVAHGLPVQTSGVYIGYNFSGGSHKYISGYDVGAGWQPGAGASRTNSYGKLSIRRTGTTISVHYQDGAGGWVELDDWSITSENMHVIFGYNAAGGTLSANFDNFLINSGTVVVES
jgi:hypothetical protein